MANDTDLLTSNNSDVSSSCCNGEIDRRQASIGSPNMSSGAQEMASVLSAEKLDSCVANGCVKLVEGSLDCQDVTDTIVCSNNNSTEATCGADDKTAVCFGSQYSAANGLVSPSTVDIQGPEKSMDQSTSNSGSQLCLPAVASCDFSCEKFVVESAQNPDIASSRQQLADNESSDCACSLQSTEVTSAVSDLSIVDEDNSSPTVPCDDSVTVQTNAKVSAIQYVVYESESQMESIMKLITKDLSEPYSIYTYRYFIHNWPKLCFLAVDGDKCIGAIVCKLDRHKGCSRRGYIAMLAVDHEYRKLGIGSSLVVKAIHSMMEPVNGGCDEVVLETEITNSAALHLYEKLGFVRDKRLFRYYLNGVDALRLKLWLK